MHAAYMDAYLRAVYCSPSVAIVPRFPEKYVVNSVNRAALTRTTFNVDSIVLDNPNEKSRDKVQTFFFKLKPLVLTRQQVFGTNRADTDTLVADLLRAVGLNTYPLAVM